MSLSHLVPCPACTRHVRASESACPFCNAALPDALRSAPRPRPPVNRLSRAALYAFGATSLSLASVGACSSSSTPNEPNDGSVEAIALYGGCPSCGHDAGQDVAENDGPEGPDRVVAAYGAPGDAFPVDSPEETSSDGSSDADSMSAAAYGLAADH